jgi:hypothetical protein
LDSVNYAYSPDRIADRLQIQDGIHRYCRAIDRLDYDGIRSSYHPDATDSHGALFSGDVDAFIAWIRERHPWISFSMHAATNIFIEFAGDDVALVETYVRAVQRHRPGSPAIRGDGSAGVSTDVLTCSRYVDRFERRGGEWRIARRTLVTGWRTQEPVRDESAPRVDPVTSARDGTDFLFEERRSLGIVGPY